MEEMETVAGGLRTEMLTDAEKAEYNKLLDSAKRRGLTQKGLFFMFLRRMTDKYGKDIFDDYEAANDRWNLSHYNPAEYTAEDTARP